MRNPLLASSILGLTGVVLGAFGAHLLHDALAARDSAGTWETGVLYQLVHSVALLALGLQRTPGAPPVWLQRAALAWTAGVILFSGSLYLLALGGPKILGPVTPLGGAGFIAGWACVFMHARSAGASGPRDA